MIITASDRRYLRETGIAFQILGLIVITWGFLIPASLSVQILISLAVTFIIFTIEHIKSAMDFSRKEATARSWIDTLAFRLAINKVILNARCGEYSIIDWEQVTREAFEDIKHAQEDDKIIGELSLSRFGWLITAVATFTIYVFYPIIGYGAALLIKIFVPGMA